ncbi:phospholipase C, phosphocholine-specific, partial [Escherichia coli]|nr:phospholipase C, phosphocholine-specific [Escherichia coli]
FGVAEPNISPFRRAVCGDLTSAFNFKTPNTESLPTLAGRATRAAADQLRTAQEALPQMPLPTDMQLPLQASGTRPSRALPYELHTSARCAAA